MTEQAISTLNDTPAPSAGDEGTLNSGESSTPMKDGDLVSTTEFVTVQEPEQPAEKAEGGEQETPEGEGDGEKQTSESVPYERFQEKVSQFNDLQSKIAEIEKENATLKGKIEGISTTKPAEETQDKPNYIPLQGKTVDDIREWAEDDPLGFYANLAAQIQHETLRHVTGKVDSRLETRDQARTLEESYSQFAAKHDDFKPLLDSGQLDQYVKNNPGHSVFSAYHALTEGSQKEAQENAINEAVAKAVAAKEQEFKQNQKAKREIRTVSNSTTTTPHNRADELKNLSKTHGNVVGGLAAMLKNMRARAG